MSDAAFKMKNYSSQYERQLMLPEIGEHGQKMLQEASVLIAGVGGLGSSVSYYLAAAGIGTLVIYDYDTVQISNLNRQILHSHSSINEKKVESAYERLHDLNPDINIRTFSEAITIKSINSIGLELAVLVDCLDNFEARQVLNQYSIDMRVPMVYGSICGFDGHLSVFNPPMTPCFHCVFQGTSFDGEIPVLGATAGVIGSLQAMETIKLITGVSSVLRNTILRYEGKETSFCTLSVERDSQCQYCSHLSLK